MKKERKDYEVPAMLVYQLRSKPFMQTGSGGSGSGTGDVIQGPSDSRRYWIEDEE